MTSVQITRVDQTELFRVADLVTTSFFDLDVAHWLVPDPEERRLPLRGHILLGVQEALRGGHIDAVEHGSAVAVWRYLPDGRLPTPPDYARKLRELCTTHTDRFLTFDDALEQHHPHDRPHDYLMFLATDPEHQGRGHGSALLRSHHQRLDAKNRSAFLVASCTDSRRLYEREGYELLRAYDLPSGPTIFAMMRPPQGTRR